MKQLQEIENNVKAARTRLRLFLVEVQTASFNRISRCGECRTGGCRDCLESHQLHAEAQKMLNDE